MACALFGLTARYLEQVVEFVFWHTLERAEIGARQRGDLMVVQQAGTVAALLLFEVAAFFAGFCKYCAKNIG